MIGYLVLTIPELVLIRSLGNQSKIERAAKKLRNSILFLKLDVSYCFNLSSQLVGLEDYYLLMLLILLTILAD
jgi:hypothetical protein